MSNIKVSNLDIVLTETISEVLRNIFEVETSSLIIGYLDKNGQKKFNEKVKFFAELLPKILGIGSSIIEDLVLENMYLKYGLELQRKKGVGFVKYLTDLEEALRNK